MPTNNVTQSAFLANDRVDWSCYARGYDLVTRLNPAYQDILQRVRAAASRWSLSNGDTIVEIGAGTGNVSTLLAGLFPRCSVIHADTDLTMNALAAEKGKRLGLANLQIVEADASALSFDEGSVAAVVCIHSLYTFDDPLDLIARATRWLKPGGAFLACDLGREMNVADWRKYMVRQLVAQLGLWKAVRIILKTREVAMQNRRITAEQRLGRYWLHSLDDFRQAFEAHALVVEEAAVCFRGYSDFVACTKPSRPALGVDNQPNAIPLASGAREAGHGRMANA